MWASYYRSLYTLKTDSTGTSPVMDLDSYVSKLKAHLASHPGRIAAVAGQMLGSKARCAERLPSLAVSGKPCLAIYGGSDPDFSDVKAEGEELLGRLRDGRPASAPAPQLEIVPGCGHYPHVEAPEAVTQHIAAFVRSLALTDEDHATSASAAPPP